MITAYFNGPTDISDAFADSGDGYYVRVASEEKLGVVRPDGTTITVDQDGTIHGSTQVDVATDEEAGIVRPDGETIAVDDGVISVVPSPHWEIRTDGEGKRRLAIVIPEEE